MEKEYQPLFTLFPKKSSDPEQLEDEQIKLTTPGLERRSLPYAKTARRENHLIAF